jgi:glycosyltransferase involved in cell wall biosynthesis
MNLLAKENIDFNYTIVGVDKNEELLYKQSQFVCKNKVTFMEKMHFLKVKELIKNADVLLLSSVEEGIANVVLEAMALGTLVVSTECGGMNEVIKNNENGFLVPIRNSEAIATTIKKITEIPVEKYLSLTQDARKTVENQHSHNRMIEEMKDLYQLVLKEEL